MEPLPVHNRSRWGETERMELSPTTRRRQFSSAITPPTKTILAIMALFRVSLGLQGIGPGSVPCCV